MKIIEVKTVADVNAIVKSNAVAIITQLINNKEVIINGRKESIKLVRRDS